MKVEPITADRLAGLGACADQVALFQKLFPRGAPLTVETAVAVADQFHWGWAALHLLQPAARKLFTELNATAWNKYNNAMAPVTKVFKEATVSGWGPLKAFDLANRRLYKALCEDQATAFATAYLSQS
jgi:hypothetical protein